MVLEKIIHVYPCTFLATALSSAPLIASSLGFIDLPNALGASAIITGFGVYFGMSERENYELIGSLVRSEGLPSILQDKSFKNFHKTAEIWEKNHNYLIVPKTDPLLISSQQLKKAG